MDRQQLVDSVDWYHEFDFGEGVKASSKAPDAAWHRRVWQFIERQLEDIDFRDRTVLDVGAWDGYWSFYAERRGAAYVLAADDLTQNWSSGRGIHVAKELLQSDVEINQAISVYELQLLRRTFDIVICFGVYYHLYDPFYAFSQIRHCCHDRTQVLLDGDIGRYGMRPDEARCRFDDSRVSTFVPSLPVFETVLKAAYLSVQSHSWLNAPGRFRRASPLTQTLRLFFDRPGVDRAFTKCRPFTGVNDLHPYRPPFGLVTYDDRFRE